MADRTFQADAVIAGGGLAGIVTAYELIERGKKVLLIDKDTPEKLGGLARESFGGIHLVGTPHQKRLRIRDDPDLAYGDWLSRACFGPEDEWPRRWARFYCDHSLDYIYDFLASKKVTFLPLVNWVERGIHAPGNSVPRWHIAWGTGKEIIRCLTGALDAHRNRGNLEVLFDHEVNGIDLAGGRADCFVGRNMTDGRGFRAAAEHLVVASGGICGGDLSKVRANWHGAWGRPPAILLNGAHIYGDGLLHETVSALGGNVTHLDRQWHYPSGVHHPAKRKPDDGLSLVPPRSALWMNARGARIGPMPLVAYADTRALVEAIVREPGQYSWQVLNWKIAIKELAVSGSEYMEAFAAKSRVRLFKELLFGNPRLVERLIRECPDDILVANTLTELADKMNRQSLFGLKVDLERMERDIRAYDDQIDRGRAYFNDEQLRRIMNARTYITDRLRTCKYQKILDPKARPLIAIREFILSRKSLGGIQTDLQCRVLGTGGGVVPGLYAVGESAGFGGGGINGASSLEGTFLGGCVLTARVAAQAIAGSSCHQPTAGV
jgi:predicted oxidoreductase